jgi:hypothetical protein
VYYFSFPVPVKIYARYLKTQLAPSTHNGFSTSPSVKVKVLPHSTKCAGKVYTQLHTLELDGGKYENRTCRIIMFISFHFCDFCVTLAFRVLHA